MQDLLRKTEANAAARLTLPPGRMATQELGRYKTFLKVESHRLKILHRAGGGGLEICRARAAMMDVLLRYLWETARSNLSEQARREFPQVSLVAIGGYGRAELNPHSDMDFMFLHNRQVVVSRPLPHLSKLLDGVLYPLWDLGLKVGHSVRTIDECVNVANGDMQAKTSLIEARLIAGDEALFTKFQSAIVRKCVAGHEHEYIPQRMADQAARRAKFGNSASMQEPNLKSGCGGLRDFQNLLWMAFFKYRTRSLKDLKAQGFIGESERKQLEAAYDFLLRVRTEMHYHTNRAMDVLSKSLQPAVAYNLGYRDRSPSKRIEAFMRDLYQHFRNIYLLTRTLEERMALLPREPTRMERFGLPGRLTRLLPRRQQPAPEPVDGFRFVDGQIVAASNRVFRDQPRRLMRVFLHAQQRGLKLHPDLAQLIRNQLSLVDRAFLREPHVRETFLQIMNQRGNVAPILRAMHEVGLLGKYIPEFGKLTCLVQHEFYHQYTADEHTLVCLEQLDRIWEAGHAPHNAYSAIFQELDRPFLLYLGLLLHDVGKSDGHGAHAKASAGAALRVSRRLGLDASATETLRVIIEHHLIMASVSQRRDLDDPAVIRQFAQQVQHTENLELLTLLTFADAQATSDKLWNSFKDALLWSLYEKAWRLLTGGTEFIRAEEQQLESLHGQLIKELPKEISQEELEAHFETLPARYFQSHASAEILEDLGLTHEFMHRQVADAENALQPVVSWQNDPDRGGNNVKICTWDRAGLFRKIAGSFSAAGLNIFSARIFTRTDGVVLDTFFVADARTGNLADRAQRENFEDVINRALTGETVDFPALIRKKKITRPIYQDYTGERIPTRIHFDNEASDSRTVIEIETEDRVGVLYMISESLTELELDISAAKIATEKGAVIDSFYVRELTGEKVLAVERHQAIERRLRHAIHSLDAG